MVLTSLWMSIKGTGASAKCQQAPKVRNDDALLKRAPCFASMTPNLKIILKGSALVIEIGKASTAAALATCALFGWVCNPAAATVHIEGQVQAGGGPLANSTVTLWEANAGDPKQLAQTQTGSDGRFELGTDETPGADVSAASAHSRFWPKADALTRCPRGSFQGQSGHGMAP